MPALTLASEPDGTPGDNSYTLAEIEELFDTHEQSQTCLRGALPRRPRRRCALYDPGAAATCKVGLRAKT